VEYIPSKEAQVGVANHSDTEVVQLRKRISELEKEKRLLSETCDTLSDTQAALENLIGASNEKLLAAEMLSMELEQVFSSCADATWVVRQDGVVIRANQAMLQFLGRSPDQVVGRRCKDLLDACICREGGCPLPAAHRHPSFHEYDIERRTDRGETEYFLVSTSSLVTLDGSPGIVAQFKDITLRKRTEEALEQANVALERLARIDGLTQVANRRTFDEALGREWQRLSREKAPLSLVLCDIDFFKKYNDHYGHQAGDECLRRVARTLSGCAKRPADMLARYGGEEFVFLLPQTPLEGARMIAEKARLDVEEMGLRHEASVVKPVVTLSLGAAAVVPDAVSDPETLVKAADEALYRAKEAGRNRVVTG
jgi:diguanylate cyclase (GGDEF)-like protein/PAS domain S-box-containing protein